jgi:hypothetical protein
MTKSVVKPTVALRAKPRVSGFVPAAPELVKRFPGDPGKVQAPTAPVSPIVPTATAEVVKPTTEESSFQNDGRYVLLSDLPTGYLYYTFKDLWVRPFTPNEARLLHMAKVSGNLTYLISAVAACLSQPINKLIIEDFEFVLYWLRMNSYPNRPFSVTWTCNRIYDETSPEELIGKQCTRENISIINKSNMTIEPLALDFKLDPLLDFPTISIFEETWDLKRKLEDLDVDDDDPEDVARFERERDEIIGDIYLLNIAQWIKTENGTALEKLQALKDSTDMGYQDQLEEAIDKVPYFGVSESLAVHCEECGGETKRRLTLDYLTFFP